MPLRTTKTDTGISATTVLLPFTLGSSFGGQCERRSVRHSTENVLLPYTLNSS